MIQIESHQSLSKIQRSLLKLLACVLREPIKRKLSERIISRKITRLLIWPLSAATSGQFKLCIGSPFRRTLKLARTATAKGCRSDEEHSTRGDVLCVAAATGAYPNYSLTSSASSNSASQIVARKKLASHQF